jgi:hypothetical protein
LGVEDLTNIELVCSRWSYLANTPELWIYKCKKFALRENFSQIEQLITNELSTNEDIDWKHIYIEILNFYNSDVIKQLKLKYHQPKSKNNHNFLLNFF